jgi:hypothetical protein
MSSEKVTDLRQVRARAKQAAAPTEAEQAEAHRVRQGAAEAATQLDGRGLPEEDAIDGGMQLDAGGDAGGDGDRGGKGEDGSPFFHHLWPIIPLGVRGNVCYYLDANKQVVALTWEKHSHNNIKGMMGPMIFLLEEICPRKKPIFDKEDKDRIVDWEINGWKPEEAADQLISQASYRGIWNPYDKIRGVGAWRGAEGRLILHCGDAVYVSAPQGSSNKTGKWHEPGLIDGYVYPRGAPTHRPDSRPVAAATGRKTIKGKGDGAVEGWLNPGDAFRENAMTWNLARGDLDAHLALGIAASQMLGGALKVRPGAWSTGGLGTGKSTFIDMMKDLHGANGMIKLDDTSPAYIWQSLKYDSRPVLLDENGDEGDGADQRKAAAMLKLIRIAVTGGKMGRGGSNHEAVDFTARSSFFCGSILMPALEAQDRSRIIVFELGQLSGGKMPDVRPDRMASIGKSMLTRLVHQWQRFDVTFAAYHAALQAAGHISRTADIFGMALTCADLVLYDRVPAADDEHVIAWAKRLDPEALQETSAGTSDQVECWQHLLASIIDPYRQGARSGLRDWIDKASNRPPKGMASYTAEIQKQANDVLQTYGLRVVFLPEIRRAFGARMTPELEASLRPPYLAVANKHPSLAALYKEKRWANGVWAQSLKRLPGALAPPKPIWLAGDDANAIEGGAVRVTMVRLYERERGQAGDQPAGQPAAGNDGLTGVQPVNAAFDFQNDQGDEDYTGSGGAAGGGDDDDLPV